MPDQTDIPVATQKAHRLKTALREAARLARRSSRSRRSFDVSTFSRRRGALVLRLLYIASFWLLFVLPAAVGGVYFGFIASPQYVAEARFTVNGGEGTRIDGLGSITGMPSNASVQDTQIVTNYIRSQAIVGQLQDRIDLRGKYGASTIDPLSRFDREQPLEKLVDFWKSKTEVSIELPAGIVEVSTKAFTAADAFQILKDVLKLSEALVNDLNRQMLHDNVDASERELERAAIRLVRARLALERVRNSEGFLDAGQAGQAISDLITGLRGDQLKLQQEYDSMQKYVTADAPQMRTNAARIKAIDEQIKHLEATLTSRDASNPLTKQMSQSMTKFSELETEYKVAERQYSSAAAVLTLAKTMVERRLVYFQLFVRPSLPQEPTYPKRVLSIAIVVVGSFLSWAIVCGLVSLARNNMA